MYAVVSFDDNGDLYRVAVYSQRGCDRVHYSVRSSIKFKL